LVPDRHYFTHFLIYESSS